MSSGPGWGLGRGAPSAAGSGLAVAGPATPPHALGPNGRSPSLLPPVGVWRLRPSPASAAMPYPQAQVIQLGLGHPQAQGRTSCPSGQARTSCLIGQGVASASRQRAERRQRGGRETTEGRQRGDRGEAERRQRGGRETTEGRQRDDRGEAESRQRGGSRPATQTQVYKSVDA
jgi:hypothetical protein